MYFEVFDPQEKLKSLSYKKEIQKFSANLEKGDLSMSQAIEYGFILSGQTRAGKTATAHSLSGNSLKGVKTSGESMVQTVTTRNKKARIGNTMNSETLVPNVFQVKLHGKQDLYHIIDTPGYGDTNGVLTIMANGYYQYRLFSKVKKMKFLLCFDFIHLQNTAQLFMNSIIQWTSSFKDYLLHRKQIWKSVAFIITKVDQKPTTKEDLIAKLNTIVGDMKTQYETKVEDAMKQLIEFVIKEDRLFYIKKIKDGETNTAGDLLDQIDKKLTHWWSRDYDEMTKQVDMRPVSFAVSEQIINSTTISKKFRDYFVQLINYYNIRIKEFLQEFNEKFVDQRFSLSFVIQQLINDAMGHPDSHKFLDVMAGYVDMYYKNYDDSYKEQRQNLEKLLFGCENENSLTEKSRSKFRGKDKNYLVKKFQCLKRIEQLKQEINHTKIEEQKQLAWLQNTEHHLYQIIKEFNKIAFKRNKAIEIIYKFGYLIHRIVEEAKVFILLVQIYVEAQNNRKIFDLVNPDWICLIVQLKDFMGVSFKFNKKQIIYEELHLSFIKKFNFDDKEYESLVINETFVDFFSQVDIIDEDDIEKQVNLLLKYSDQVLEDSENLSTFSLTKQIGDLIYRLVNVRANCEATYDLKQKPNQKSVQMFLIRRATKNLGKLLELLGKFELARKVYETIRFVDSICKLFRAEINSFTKIGKNGRQSTNKSFELRMKFSKFLADNFRENEAIQVLQQSFEQVQDINELTEVRNQLSELRLRLKEGSFVTNYESQLFNQEYFKRFQDDLINEITKLSKNTIK